MRNRIVPGFTFAALLFACGGCAFTEIETPIGTYRSTRDAALDDLHIVIDREGGGRERTEVTLGGARGEASSVIDSQRDFLRALFEAAYGMGRRGRAVILDRKRAKPRAAGSLSTLPCSLSATSSSCSAGSRSTRGTTPA